MSQGLKKNVAQMGQTQSLLQAFDTKGSPGVRDSQIIMPDSLFLLVGSPTDSLNLGGNMTPNFLS